MNRTVLPFVTAAFILVTTVGSAEAANKGVRGASGGGAQVGAGNPAQMAQKLVQMGDKTGDGSLNPQELAAALTALRRMRADGAKGPDARGAKGAAGAARGPSARRGNAPRPGGKPQGAGRRGGPGGAAGGMDPAQMAKRMCERNDTNGDGALNPQELAAAFMSMREMRAKGAGGQAGPGGPRDAGGRRPKRPE